MFKNWEILVRFVDRVWHFDVAKRFRVRFFYDNTTTFVSEAE